jgi:arginine-tRNA-protein transferase
MTDYSIIEYLGASSKDRCGYCKTENGSNSVGFWAHTLTVDDYQALINRNWRRSGQYCYLPTNKDTCCPAYTIRCDVDDFKLNKSHKKILKRMNKFLKDGIKEKDHGRHHDGQSSTDLEAKPSQEHSDVNLAEINYTSLQNESSLITQSNVTSDIDKKIETKSSSQSVASTSNKPSNPKKAKIIRLERKKEKLAARGLTLNDVKPKVKPQNVEKTLEDLLAQEPIDGKHRLKVTIDNFH